MIVPRDYQTEAVEALRANIRKGIRRQVLCGPTGSGKCHPAGTKVLLYSGDFVPVESVQPGMLLMGPDSQPRQVQRVGTGHGDLFRIIPRQYGDPFVVNLDHKLTLVRTNDGTSLAGRLVDVPLRDWMDWSSTAKHVHKLTRTGVDFPEVQDGIFGTGPDLSPYHMGLFLGDGSILTTPQICTTDLEIKAAVYDMEKHGVSVYVDDREGRAPIYHLTSARGQPNPIQDILRRYGVWGHKSHDKFIPRPFRLGSREDRLELLAGLIDTDGYLAGGYFEFCTVSPRLAGDVAFVARSLGFGVSVTERHNPFSIRVNICGDVDIIPTRIPRKQAGPRKQKNSVLRSGFAVEPAGVGEWFGFTLDDDGRYLLEDFTVTHNTEMAAILMEAARLKMSRVSFLVHRQNLVLQTSERLAGNHIPHGIVMGDWPRSFSQPIQICSIQTLTSRAKRNPDLPLIAMPQDLVVVDECHEQFAEVSRYLLGDHAPRATIGLTATPFTKGLGKVYEAVVNVRTTDQLLADGWLAPLKVFCATPIDMTGAKVSNGEWSEAEVEKRAIPITGDIVSDWVAHTNRFFGGPVKTICFAASVAHGEKLVREFQLLGYDFHLVSYRDKDSDERQRKIGWLKDGRIDGLISVEALAKGFDVPDIKCVISARPYRTALASHIQQIGRGMRAAPDKEFCLLLDHSGNYLRHARATEWFWANGAYQLDTGKKRKAGHQEPPDKTRECRECKMVLPPDAAMCPNCGAARPRRQSKVEHQAGVMREYKRASDEIGDIWPDLSALAIEKYPDDPAAAVRWARGVHNGIMGSWPAWNRPLQPATEVDYRVVELVEKNARRYRRQKKREEKQQNLTV